MDFNFATNNILVSFGFAFVLFVIPISLVALVISQTSRMIHRKRQLITQVIIAEYDPPEHISPAEIGYLYDSKIGQPELYATLFDLEQRGYIVLSRLEHDTATLGLGSVDDLSKLGAHELYVLNNLTMVPTQVGMGYFYQHQFKKAVVLSLKSRELIISEGETYSYLTQRAFYAYVIISILLSGWLIIGASGSLVTKLIVILVFGIVLLPVFIALAIAAGLIYNTIVGQTGLWSAKAKKMWPQVEGYRDFVEQVELNQLQFESEDLKTTSRNHALPYAIALGLNAEWQKRFKA